MKKLAAIRGAVCCENTPEDITKNVCAMCNAIFEQNQIKAEDLVSIQFSLTKDLDTMNPCTALRKGYQGIDISQVPLFCTQEAFIQGGLEKVIRVLVFVYLEEGTQVQHIYLGGASKLRPDLKKK